MKRKFSKRQIKHVTVLFDFITVYCCFMASFFIKNITLEHSFFCFVSICFIIIFTASNLYKEQMGLLHINEITSIFKSIFIGFILISLLVVYSAEPDEKKYGILRAFLFMFIFVPMERVMIRKILQRLYIKGIGARNTLIIGSGRITKRLMEQLKNAPKLGFNVSSVLNFSELRDYKHLISIIKLKKIEAIFLGILKLDFGKIAKFMEICKKENVVLNIVPIMHNFLIENIKLENIEGIPVFSFKQYSEKKINLYFKRIVDIIVSLSLILLLFPLGSIIAFMIKITSSGSVFFEQERVGKNGKIFKIIKFRTMYKETLGNEFAPKTGQDKRITKIGNILRKTSLDELPQLFNVLSGDMSLVGPRPEMSFIVEKYNDIHKIRLMVKPGVTGLWQVGYHRHELIHENIEYDLFYIEHQTLLLDLVIMLRTVKSMLFKTGI